MPKVIGIDLSLTSTGVAGNAGTGWSSTIRPKRLTGLPRMDNVVAALIDLCVPADLVVLEGPSFGSSGAGSHERAGLWWLTLRALVRRDVPVAIAPPSCRALYAFGKGDANKREVLAGVAEWFPAFDVTRRPGLQDECDAFVLCALGADWMGHPMAALPDAHRKALDGVDWPDVVGRQVAA